MSASDPDDSGSTPRSDDEESSSESELRWSSENWLIILLFIGLSVLGVAISTGEIRPEFAAVSNGRDSPVSIPMFVYLYASLGALGYVFTRLITRLEDFVAWGNVEELVEMALRIPAAWILAAGVYLFLPLFVPDGTNAADPWFAAGTAFLVGLYVNVAFKALGGLAERLLGRSVGSSPQERAAEGVGKSDSGGDAETDAGQGEPTPGRHS